MARPRITLKLATSLDGKIALANGMSEWITGEKARAEGRKLRARHDAIAVGANTAVLDNPQLTTRIDGEEDPVRVIFDTNLRLSWRSNLARTAKKTPVWLFTNVTTGENAEALEMQGVRLLKTPLNDGLDLGFAMSFLHEYGIASLLVEGGGTLAASFLRLDAIDVIEWFRAPIILGGDSRGSIGDLGLENMNLAKRFNRIEIRDLGDDLYERYERIV
ncbi:RibD family protein [Hellea balneolensis]|uniref:RibD family protein n=1 Tax=Hellea balneolensis TaxID=287478 RepID=UPI0004173D7D|nr:RibD family protein [Hellea balneolensis]